MAGAALLTDHQIKNWRDRIRADVHSHYHVCMALALADQNNAAQAETHYRTALAHDPACAVAGFQLLSLLEAQGRKAEAESVVQSARRVNPDFMTAAQIGLARLHADNGEVTKSLSYLQEYRTRPGADPVAAATLLLQIAEIYKAKGPRENFDKYVDLAYAASADIAGQSLLPAQYLIDQLRLDEADQALSLYLEHHPDDAMGWHLAAISAQVKDRLDDAIAASEKALHLAALPAANLQRGLSLLALGRVEDAEAAIRTAVTASGNALWAKEFLLWSLIAGGQLDEAASMEKDPAMAAPLPARARSNSAILLLRAGQIQQAEQVISQITDVGLSVWHQIWVSLNRCLIHKAAGRESEALSAMKDAHMLSPQLTRFYIRCRPWCSDELLLIQQKLPH